MRKAPHRARATPFQHPSPHTSDTSLKSRWRPSLRSSSPPGASASPRPSLRPRASGRRDAPWRIDPISRGARTITRAASPRYRERPSSTYERVPDDLLPFLPRSRRLTQKSRTVRPRGVAAKARSAVKVGAVASARPVWCPGTPAPAHLDGTLPCDYGFDPLNLGACPLPRNAGEGRVARARYPVARMDFQGGSTRHDVCGSTDDERRATTRFERRPNLRASPILHPPPLNTR